MSKYVIKDIFLTLQGEGGRTGTKAVFVRTAACNLWSGLAAKRDEGAGACARWCDTDFFKGVAMDHEEIAQRMAALWPPYGGERWCVLTGGEPTLQIDDELMGVLGAHGWKIAVETNGTKENDALRHADHICIAPKLDARGVPLHIVLPHAHEIKVVLPGGLPGEPGWSEEMLLTLETQFPRARYYVQPQDPLADSNVIGETALLRRHKTAVACAEGPEAQLSRNVQRCLKHVMDHPRWVLSLQTHKLLGLP